MAIAGVMARFLGAVKIGRLYLSHQTTGLTAFSTGGQTNATLLNRVLNVVGTVAANGDSVKLMPIVQSDVVIVVNKSASHSLTVFTNETSGVSINGTAGSTGVSISAGGTGIFFATDPANWYALIATATAGSFTTLSASGTATMAEVDATKVVSTGIVSGTFLDGSATDGISAAGTTQGTATALTTAVNRVSTVSATTAGVSLPAIASVGVGGTVVVQNNDGANAMHVYSAGSETIDAATGSTGVILSHGKTALYFAVTAAKWISIGAVFSA